MAAGRGSVTKLTEARDALQAFLDGTTDNFPDDKLSKLTGASRLLRRRSGEGDESDFRENHRQGIADLVAELRAAGEIWENALTGSGNFREVVLHNPDQIAGGYYQLPDLTVLPVVPRPADDPTGATSQQDYDAYKERLLDFCGAVSANSSLGSQWRTRIEGAVTSVQAAFPQAPPRPIFKMNLKLNVGS